MCEMNSARKLAVQCRGSDRPQLVLLQSALRHRRADQAPYRAPYRAKGRAPGQALYRAPERAPCRKWGRVWGAMAAGAPSGALHDTVRTDYGVHAGTAGYMYIVHMCAGTGWYRYTYIVTLHSHWFYFGKCIPKTKPRRGRSRRASQATAKKQNKWQEREQF